MGNFGGHVLPGSFFMIFGLWHVLQLSVHYFRAKKRCGPPFQAKTYFSSPCGSKFPIEPVLKLIGATAGSIGEVITAFKENKFVHIGNGQHICMYTFFGFTAFLEILSHYKFYLPNGIIYISYALSFFVEALLFYWHLHVSELLEVQVHNFLLYVVAATICSLFVEMKYGRNILPAICRTYFILLQGVWFWQMAFILFPPSGWQKWDWKSHEQMMLVTIIFCADAFITLVIVMIIWFVVACRYGSLRQEIIESKNGYTPALPTNTDFLHEFKMRKGDLAFQMQDEEDALISE